MSQVDFFSRENTKYVWVNGNKDLIIILSPFIMKFLTFRIKLMSDIDILNTVSGNGIPMGIHLPVDDETIISTRISLQGIVRSASTAILLDSHAVSRLAQELIIARTGIGKPRNWQNNNDVINCVKTITSIDELRLNVNHKHTSQTQQTKYLHDPIGIKAKGTKASGNGTLVVCVTSPTTIVVITIL